jgi:hypothetical protein
MTRILAVAVTALIAGWNAADTLTPSAVLLAAAALAVTGLVILILAARHLAVHLAPEARASSVALRERASRAVFIRLRDPDAAGRPRPRAPSAHARAARA